MLNPNNEIEGVGILASNEISTIKKMNNQFEEEKRIIKDEYKAAIIKANDTYKIKLNDLESRKIASKIEAKSKKLSASKESFFKIASKISITETKIEKRIEGLSKKKDTSEAKIILDKAKQEMIGAKKAVDAANNKIDISNARKIVNEARKLMKDVVNNIKNLSKNNSKYSAAQKIEQEVKQSTSKINSASNSIDKDEPTTDLQPVEGGVSDIEKTLE